MVKKPTKKTIEQLVDALKSLDIKALNARLSLLSESDPEARSIKALNQILRFHMEAIKGDDSISSFTLSRDAQTLLEDLARSNSSLASQKAALDASAIVAETDTRGIITYVNDKFLEISKYTREQLMGQDHRILNSGHHPKEFFTFLWKSVASGKVWHGEVKNKAADGTYYWVDTTVYPAKDEFGKTTKFVAIRFDITDRKLAEENIRESAEKAKAAMESKSQFLANISHEIRTPMNGIIGFTSVLMDQNLNSDQAQSVQIIKSCSEHLLVLINDFLDFSKIEAGKISLEMRTIDIPHLINISSYVVDSVISQKGLILEKKIPPSIPGVIISDPTRIKQIIINLISNAAKFTEKGKITLSVDVINSNGKSVELLFCVADTGIGIPKGHMEKLFNAFTQADASTSRRFGGTGLGLSISKSMVELLGGKIWVESEEGVGSKFFFTIKALRGNEITLQSAQDNRGEIQNHLGKMYPMKILVAEDNKLNQLLTMKLLKKLNYDATLVENGKEAVAAALAGNYDVILMDCQMPEMDGLEATKIIRAHFSNQLRPYIIALTANAMDGDREKCRGAGMTGFISKPVRLQDLADDLLGASQRLGIKAHDLPETDAPEPLKPTGTQ